MYSNFSQLIIILIKLKEHRLWKTEAKSHDVLSLYTVFYSLIQEKENTKNLRNPIDSILYPWYHFIHSQQTPKRDDAN